MPLKLYFRTQKGKLISLLALFIFSNSVSTIGQLQVTMPIERSVFQRVNNVASIHIGGNILSPVDQIQARVIPIQGGQAMDWKSIDASIGGGNFVGELSYVYAGWYKLEVRAVVNGVQLGEISTVSKVGVGEVFVIAGQSNAQGGRPPMGGFYDNTKYGATDDRVNCINYFDIDELGISPFPKISHLDADIEISPQGHSSWCWGLLGDRIAKELNVPVIFFNAAEGGTRMSQWAQSARGEQTYNYYTSGIPPLGWPYINLKKSLNFYASIYGIRAILWHQGEDDGNINTDYNSYKSDLETVIRKSREHTGKNISWMVAKVSRSNVGTKQAITGAQQAIIDISGFNVFPGPDTDDIQPSVSQRDDGVHFHGSGLIQLADAWAAFIINESFLSKSIPFLARPLVKINSSNCSYSNAINLSLPNNYSSPVWFWNDGNSKQESYTKTISANEQVYGLVKENNNFLISPPIKFTPTSIEISLLQQPKICLGQSLTLKAVTPSNNYLWNTGEKSQQINLSKAGSYNISVNAYDVYGCDTRAETSFNLQVLPLPQAPSIEAQSATVFCEGGIVQIKDKAANSNYSKIWNTSEATNSIQVSKSGNYSLQAIDENGCKSNISNSVEVKVNPLPLKPQILTEGKKQFCVGDSLKLISTKAIEYLWKSQAGDTKTKSNEFYIQSEGNYSVKTTNEFGCSSQLSDQIFIKQLSLPLPPTIEILGKNVLCAGDSTIVFTSNTAKSYSWFSDAGNIEASVSEKLQLTTFRNSLQFEKNYKLKITDQNDCTSPFSNIINVKVKANPPKPIIEKLGPYSLIAKLEQPKDIKSSFFWLFDNVEIKSSEELIKVTKSGNYKTKAQNVYKIDNSNLTCISDYSDPFRLDLTSEELAIYPNPVNNGYLNIESLIDQQNVSLRLLTVNGQEVLSIKNIDSSIRNQIYLGKLNGYFIVEINAGGKFYRKNIWVKN